MINETCNVFNFNSINCIELGISNNIINNFHIYVGMFFLVIIFLANLFGDKIGKNKYERIFYGLIVLFSIIPIVLISYSKNIILMFLSLIIFLFLYYHYLNYNNIHNYLLENKFLRNVASNSFKIVFLVFLFFWLLFNLFFLLKYFKNLNELILLTFAFLFYFLLLILFVIDSFLSLGFKNKIYSGKIKYVSGKSIDFDFIDNSNLGFIKIINNNNLIEINKDSILEIRYKIKK